MILLIIIQHAVHPNKHEVDNHAGNGQAEKKAEDSLRTQIASFVFRMLRILRIPDCLITHAPVPKSPANAGRTTAAMPALLSCGKRMSARIRRSQPDHLSSIRSPAALNQ